MLFINILREVKKKLWNKTAVCSILKGRRENTDILQLKVAFRRSVVLFT